MTGLFVNTLVSSLQMFRRAVLHILLSSFLFLSLLSSLSNCHVPPARTMGHGAKANKSAKNGTLPDPDMKLWLIEANFNLDLYLYGGISHKLCY